MKLRSIVCLARLNVQYIENTQASTPLQMLTHRARCAQRHAQHRERTFFFFFLKHSPLHATDRPLHILILAPGLV